MNRAPRARTILGDVAAMARRVTEAHAGRAWPAKRWQKDPIGFTWTILGLELWSFQVEFLEAILESDRVSVAGGRKIGKDYAISAAALWWYACFLDARVFMTATTARQVDGILYRELRRMFHRSGRCLECRLAEPDAPPPCRHSAMLTGKVSEVARSGIKSPDGREITGFTARETESAQGFSGACMMAIFDEASGIDDEIHHAIRGNLGGAPPGFGKEVLISNPTRLQGFFFESHHEKAPLYKCIQVSSRNSPNVVEGRLVFPGLATREWIEECDRDWGKDSPLTVAHVDGKFPVNELGAIFQIHTLAAAIERWEDTPAEGRLVIGVDPAGEDGTGDESAFAARRAKKVLRLYAKRALSAEGHLVEVLGLIAENPGCPDIPRVVIDRGGDVGAKVWGVFVSYLQGHEGAFELVGVRSSERALRQPKTYDRVRDELAAVLADWVRDGGAIPADTKLQKELNAFRWVEHVSGRNKLVDKSDLRKVLGRSPDRADALALSTWESTTLGATATEPARAAKALDAYERPPDQVFDPYAAMKAWR